MIFWWRLVFCQTYVLNLVWLNFHCCHLTTSSFENITFEKSSLLLKIRQNVFLGLSPLDLLPKIKGILEMLLLGNPLHNPLLDIDMTSLEKQEADCTKCAHGTAHNKKWGNPQPMILFVKHSSKARVNLFEQHIHSKTLVIFNKDTKHRGKWVMHFKLSYWCPKIITRHINIALIWPWNIEGINVENLEMR